MKVVDMRRILGFPSLLREPTFGVSLVYLSGKPTGDGALCSRRHALAGPTWADGLDDP